jgi:hypothetical protein
MTELFTGFTPPEELVLKPIQDEILNQVRTAFTKSKRVILQAATASGKTAIAAKIFQNATKREKRCMFICDRIVLVNQTSDEFSRWGIRHGVVMGKDHPLCIPDRPVQIASAATLLNRKIDQFDIIIQDECFVGDTLISVPTSRALWLDEKESIKLKDKVSKTNYNQSEYIRSCILNKKITTVPGIRDLVIEIKRIGNNLNQITRLANEGSLKILGNDLADIKEDLKKVWEQLAATLKKI